MSRRLILLPGSPETWVDPRRVVAVRVEAAAEQPLVVVHTADGFAVAVTSSDGLSAARLADQIADRVRRGR